MANPSLASLSTTRPSPATDSSLKLFSHYFITMNTRVIDSICAMFNDYHGNETTPSWVMELLTQSLPEENIQRLNNWRRNYPEQWQRYGIYVM